MRCMVGEMFKHFFEKYHPLLTKIRRKFGFYPVLNNAKRLELLQSLPGNSISDVQTKQSWV